MRRGAIVVAILVLLVVLAGGIYIIMTNPGAPTPPQEKEEEAKGPEEPQKQPEVEVKNPTVLVQAGIGDAETLDPAWHYDTASAEVIFNVYEPLIFYDREKIDEFIPLLATEVPSVENGLIKTAPDGTTTIAFTVREGINFHAGPVKDANGKTIAGSGVLTPEDIEYSIERGLLQDRSGGPQWLLLEPLLGVSAIESGDPDSPGLVEKFKAQLAEEHPDWSEEEIAKEADLEACSAVKRSVEADGDRVIFKLAEPFPPFLQILAGTWGVALDREWVIAQGGWDGSCETWRNWHDPEVQESVLFEKMNGTGPYKLERWDRGAQEIVLVRNENYWRGAADCAARHGAEVCTGLAKLERVVLKVVDEWGTRLKMFEAGDADIIAVPTQFIDQVEPLVREEYSGGEADPKALTIKNPDGTVRVFKDLPSVSMGAAFFNQAIAAEGNPLIGSGKLDGQGIPPDFFSDIDVRKGFLYSFDWDIYLKGAFKGEAEQPRGPIIRGVLGFNPEQPVYSYDPDKAKEHFKRAWDGKLWEVGFKMTILYNTGNEARKTAAELIERNVERLNPKFQIEVNAVDWPAFLQDMVARRLPIFIIGWLEDYHDPHNWVHPFLHSKGAFAGFMGLPKELQTKLDGLIEQARRELDPQKRQQIYYQIQQIAYDEALEIFLYQPLGRHYERTWIKGWYYNPAYPGTYFYALSKG